MKNRIGVIGIGEDGVEGLSQSARGALTSASIVFGGVRHLAMLPDEAPRERIAWSKDLSADLERMAELSEQQSVAVMASGDPMLHGIGVRIVERFGIDNVHIIPSSSAFSLAAARMGWPLGDPMVKCISIHALPFESVLQLVQPNIRLLILSRDKETPERLAKELVEVGYGGSRMCVMERMGGKHERKTVNFAVHGFAEPFDNLNTIAVTCIPDAELRPLSRAPGLPDDAFEHDNTITKQEVRAITMAALAPKPGEVLWDVGAGNGTVAIEWLRAEPSAFAIAFEEKPDRSVRITENAKRLGTPELQVIEGHFPPPVDGFEPSPDAIFVGGGIATDNDLIRYCMRALSIGGRLVANAVTLQAQAALTASHAEWGGELVSIAIARSADVGPHQAMKPSIEVLQWRGRKE
jgi:precorrin-6Y C5,15-methyltransferase (decarboxylating)